MNNADIWNTEIFQSSEIIRQLSHTTNYFKDFTHWPEIKDFKKLFLEHGLKITPVRQSNKIESFEELYEPRIYLKKELQTRTENWHDFFNAMIWLNFPKTKTTLNELHFKASTNRPKGSNRSTLENRITQFDECGAVILSSQQHLLDLVEQHQWQSLFIDQQSAFKEDFHCVVFGHAIYEKEINPYIGMTCHCLLLENKEMLEKAKTGDYSDLDHYLADQWQNKISLNPVKFSAFPVLGTPGYWNNQNEDFYQNKNYFR